MTTPLAPIPTASDSTPLDTHYRPRLNETLRGGRFTVLRKLGEGITSSIWLVRDSLANPDRYSAAKILTLEASQEPGPVRELEFLRAITQDKEKSEDDEGHDYLPGLYDHFTIPNAQNQSREHLCLVQTLYSTSVSALRRSAPTKSLPVYMVRSIIYMTLQALNKLHSLGIVHTDVKLDNILFSNAKFSLDEVLEAHLTGAPTVTDAEGFISKSQPLPNDWTYETSAFEAEKITVALIDFGHGEWAGKEPLGENFCAPSLRPPEVLLSTGVSSAVDIWTIGCLTFELLVGRWLFTPEDGGEDWSFEEDHLAKILELTGNTAFPQAILDKSPLRDKYFDKQGNLVRIPELIPVRIEDAMGNYKIPGLREQDISQAADFIRACLELDDTRRKTAKELLEHPFARTAWSD